MTTAQDFVNSSAEAAGIKRRNQDLNAGVNADLLNRFNRMLARWQNNGVDFGLPELSAADTVFVDLADEEAIEINLSLRFMVKYRRPIPAGLSEAGLEAFTELQAKYNKVNEMRLDAALTRKRAFTFQSFS